MAPDAGGQPKDDGYSWEEYKEEEASLVQVGFVWYIEPEPTYVQLAPFYAPIREWPVASRADAQTLIHSWSDHYGISVSRALRVVRCESGFFSRAKNKTSSAAGLWQFLRSTFNRTVQRMGPETLGIMDAPSGGKDFYSEYVWNAEINARMGAWLAANDGFGHWVCR